jgi:hypothetical protein
MPRLERLLPAKALLDEEPADWVMSGTSSKVNSSGWCHTIWGHGAGRTAVWSFARIMFIACHDVYRSHGKHTFPVAPAPNTMAIEIGRPTQGASSDCMG